MCRDDEESLLVRNDGQGAMPALTRGRVKQAGAPTSAPKAAAHAGERWDSSVQYQNTRSTHLIKNNKAYVRRSSS